MSDYTIYKDKLRIIRKKRGLTLRQVEDLSGISNSYLSQLERGLRVPSVSTLMRLAAAYKVDILDFLKPVEEEKTEPLWILNWRDEKPTMREEALSVAKIYAQLSEDSRKNLRAYIDFLLSKEKEKISK